MLLLAAIQVLRTGRFESEFELERTFASKVRNHPCAPLVLLKAAQVKSHQGALLDRRG